MSRILSDLASEMDCTSHWATPSFAMAEELGNITAIDGPTSFPAPKGLCRTIVRLLESALEELTSPKAHLNRTNYSHALELAMRETGTIQRQGPQAQSVVRIERFLSLTKKMAACDCYQGTIVEDDIIAALQFQRTLRRLYEISKDAGHARMMRRSNPRADLHE